MLHAIHRLAAGAIGLYALFHLANHLVALGGVERHVAFMQGVRQIVRIPAIEALLLLCVAIQFGSGLYFVARRWGQRRARFDRLQALSGLYLAFFLLVHVASVLYGRVVLALDTNFYFAAAGLHIGPYPAFFVPYYGLAVVALVTHVACAFRYLAAGRLRPVTRDRIVHASVVGAAVLASLIVATFSGAFYPITIPLEYAATFR